MYVKSRRNTLNVSSGYSHKLSSNTSIANVCTVSPSRKMSSPSATSVRSRCSCAVPFSVWYLIEKLDVGTSRPKRVTVSVTSTDVPFPSIIEYSSGANAIVPPSPSSKIVSVVTFESLMCSEYSDWFRYRTSCRDSVSSSSGFS